MNSLAVDPSPEQDASLGEVTPPQTPSPAPIPLAEISSEQLFQGAREILIRHKDETYRLRLTKNDRLILHK